MELWLYAWGMFVSSYSFFYIRYLFSLGGYEGIKGRGFLYTACILLAISVWIPYDPVSYTHLIFKKQASGEAV